MALKHWVSFFDELENIRGRSKNTVMAYRRDLELYDDFLSTGKPLGQIFSFLTQKNLSTRSQARVISSVRTYLKFCQNLGEEVPELRELRPPKVKVNLPRALKIEDFKKLFLASENPDKIKTARNHITLLLLFGLGCRVSELISLDLNDYNETECWLSVVGKGGKQRLLPLTARLIEDLNTYITEVRPQLSSKDKSALLINDRGKRPSRVDIWRWLAAWSQAAGFDEPISPHKFRHGCATALLEGGADLRSIQKLLGHSSLQTTQIYTSVTTKKLKDEFDKNHPLSELK